MRTVLGSLLVLTATIVGADSLKEAFDNATVDGYIRGAYQSHDVKSDKRYEDNAIGGKLHIETSSLSGVNIGASLYTSNSVGSSDNGGLVPLRGESEKSYSILGEAYLKGQFGNTMVKIGRQEIETPFAQVDDIGMVPNTFEALIMENRDIEDTTIFIAQIQKMAGVDAEVVDSFTRVNGDKNIQTIGVTYEGVENLTLSGWYYNLNGGEIDKIAYMEAFYQNALNGFGYEIGLQYAKESYKIGETADIVGATISTTIGNSGLTLATAYTESKNRGASSGFGGGPFVSNSEYFIIDNAGEDGKATWLGAEWNAEVIGVDALTLSLGKVILENIEGAEATELDFVASYDMNDNMEMHLIYSDIDASTVGEDDAKHLRLFVNYNF